MSQWAFYSGCAFTASIYFAFTHQDFQFCVFAGYGFGWGIWYYLDRIAKAVERR